MTSSGGGNGAGAELMATSAPAGEVERLEQVALVYDPSDPTSEFDYWARRLFREDLPPWMIGRRLLELGCATGELTAMLAGLAAEHHAVEGSPRYVEAARKRAPAVTFFTSLWEEFTPEGTYSDILCVCGLEHVEDSVGLLRRMRGWLDPGGRVHVVVPNADSLHRFVGVEMGMLEERTSLSESDVRTGHRRVYTIETLTRDVHAAGLEVLHWQGIFLKMLSNRQMLDWDWPLIHALHKVGQRFPAHCAELYAVLTG